MTHLPCGRPNKRLAATRAEKSHFHGGSSGAIHFGEEVNPTLVSGG